MLPRSLTFLSVPQTYLHTFPLTALPGLLLDPFRHSLPFPGHLHTLFPLHSPHAHLVGHMDLLDPRGRFPWWRPIPWHRFPIYCGSPGFVFLQSTEAVGTLHLCCYRIYFPLVPEVLGHAVSKNEKVDWMKSGGQQSKVYGVITQSSWGGRVCLKGSSRSPGRAVRGNVWR